MSQQTLKELLEPPFRVNKLDYYYDENGLKAELIFKTNNLRSSHFDIVKDFIINALNEKYERDFGEPLRWRRTIADLWFECPKCKFISAGFTNSEYCPHCGQRLLPPEVKEE